VCAGVCHVCVPCACIEGASCACARVGMGGMWQAPINQTLFRFLYHIFPGPILSPVQQRYTSAAGSIPTGIQMTLYGLPRSLQGYP
jgi:hypothetical protein